MDVPHVLMLTRPVSDTPPGQSLHRSFASFREVEVRTFLQEQDLILNRQTLIL